MVAKQYATGNILLRRKIRHQQIEVCSMRATVYFLGIVVAAIAARDYVTNPPLIASENLPQPSASEIAAFKEKFTYDHVDFGQKLMKLLPNGLLSFRLRS